MNSSVRLTLTCALLLLLLPSLIDASNPFGNDFMQVVASAFNSMTPPKVVAGMEARSLVDCRETFVPGRDDELVTAFEKCAEDRELATKPYCLHKCAYKALHLVDSSGKLNEDNLTSLAEKVYKPKTEAAKKSQEDFVKDFFRCYDLYTPDFLQTKGSKCFGVRKLVRCLKNENSDACKERNVEQELKPYMPDDEKEDDD